MTPLASASNFQSISTAAAIIGGMTLVIGIIGLIIKLHKLDKKSAGMFILRSRRSESFVGRDLASLLSC